ncbi:MAG: hypothetical protein ACK5JO_01675 [Halodesulfovibrio sp.]
MGINRLAYFLAGAVLGASGYALVRSGKGQALLSGIVQGGYGVTEGVLARIETLKEDIEDYMAEARYNNEQKARDEHEQAASPAASPTVPPAAKPKAAAKKPAKAKTETAAKAKPASKGKTVKKAKA